MEVTLTRQGLGDLGTYLSRVPSCSSSSWVNVRTAILCSRLWGQERRGRER